MGVQAYNLGFAPRLGIAYQVTQKTVIRAGYARSFSPAGLGAIFGQGPDYDPPITLPQQVNQSNNYSPVFNLLAGPPVPATPAIGANGRYPLPDGLNVYYFFDPQSSYRIPLSDSWNFTVQREITPTLTFEAGYVGNVGRHLFVNPNVNQAALDPTCTVATCSDYDLRRKFFVAFAPQGRDISQGLYQTCNCDNSDYNSLQLKLQKRVSHGVDFLVAYTYGKAMADSETGSVFSNNLDWRQDRGPANFDRTHAVTISHVWELPFGRGRHFGNDSSRAVDLVLGGWTFNGITTLESGLPFTPTVSSAPNTFGDLNSTRPDQIGNPHVSDQNATLWFNPAAYIAPQGVGRNGLVSHNSLRGPSFKEFDLSLSKIFTITESKTLEFKWENFNAFNHVNLANPNAVVDQSGAGQITAAADMREMQFGLHFRF